MSASFRRAGGSSRKRDGEQSQRSIVGLRGTKPWTGGITLTSVGLRDLDVILGGGQPLGTCLLLEEDRWSRDLALSLTKYWCAEAVSQDHALLIPFSIDDRKFDFQDMTDDDHDLDVNIVERNEWNKSGAEELMDSLPRNLLWDKDASTKRQAGSHLGKPLEMLEEGAEDETIENAQDAEEGLRIAWQYRKSVQEKRTLRGKGSLSPSSGLSSSDVYCHSFDLSGRLKDQRPKDAFAKIVRIDCGPASNRGGFLLYKTVMEKVKDQQATNSSNNVVIRLLLFRPSVSAVAIALPLLLAHIRSELLPVVMLVTIQPWTCSSQRSLVAIRRVSDVVMQTEGFASRSNHPPPPEFRHLHGLLLLPKVSTVTACTANGGGHYCDVTIQKRPPASIYGLKRDRRKLHVSLLHIPPEDYAGAGSVSGGAVRSGAGRPADRKDAGGCGSVGPVLDF